MLGREKPMAENARLLRLDLPPDVWDRLNAEAAQHNQKIGTYVRGLILTRDTKRQVSDKPDTRKQG